MDKEHRFGVGDVDGMGIAAKGDAAVGWPCFVMTKVRSSFMLAGLARRLMRFVPVGESLNYAVVCHYYSVMVNFVSESGRKA